MKKYLSSFLIVILILFSLKDFGYGSQISNTDLKNFIDNYFTSYFEDYITLTENTSNKYTE